MSETYRVAKPEWRIAEISENEYAFEPYFEEVVSGITRKAWLIEEAILTTAVVELLRSRGWTVTEPDEGSNG